MIEHIQKHLPDIKKLITKNVLQNATAMKALLSKAYVTLPFPVRMIVKEETFVSFCMERKHLLFGEEEKAILQKKSPAKKAIKKAPAKKAVIKKPAKKK
jgi:hypothetical protein